MGGPTQNGFHGHVYPSTSEKYSSSSPLTMESKAEQKGRCLCPALVRLRITNVELHRFSLQCCGNLDVKAHGLLQQHQIFFFFCLCSGKAIMKLLSSFN